jgi:uncharacterized membrane protein YkvI
MDQRYTGARSEWFRRLVLPGFAFKAVVIGGGYATGRELASFFLPSGPRGGLYGMGLACLLWSTVCAVTFLFAWKTGSRNYRSFFRHLLGPLWPAFEFVYALALIVTLAVFAAAAGALGTALFSWAPLVGALLLMVSIAGLATFGNRSVEPVFKYVSVFLYVVYGIFLLLSVGRFHHLIVAAFALSAPTTGWVSGGIAYATYNVTAAVVVLPMIRYLRNGRDAVIAGAVAGPLAIAPAVLFFVAMTAFYPAIANEPLPSDLLLTRLDLPAFRLVFQAMIFAALMESGVAGVHAINERIAGALSNRGRALSSPARLLVTAVVLTFSVFIATRIGLVELVVRGYRLLAYSFLAVLPPLAQQIERLRRQHNIAVLAAFSKMSDNWLGSKIHAIAG